MIPKILCTQCNAEVQPTDRFCSTCGSKIEWGRSDDSSVPSSILQNDSAVMQCIFCGHSNAADVSYCESCGAEQPHRRGKQKPSHTVSTKPSSKIKTTSATTSRAKPPLIQALQSWKLTAGVAVMFIGVLVVIGLSRDRNDPGGATPSADLSQQSARMISEIEQLQSHLDAHPEDMGATLQLANLLHDVKFFPRAVVMYQRYLKSHPANPDARVDLGICYFEMSLADSTRREGYLKRAQKEMKDALDYNPRHQLAHFNLGIVNLQAGNMDEANTWFKRCVEINPNSETGKRAQQLYAQHQSPILPRDTFINVP